VKGSDKVIACLNALLANELTAVDQYLVQGHMLADWGYSALHERIAHEADDERGHVGRLVARILFLGGAPDVATRTPLAIGSNPREMIENDLKFEIEVASTLNDAIALCRDERDNGTREMLEQLLRDTEEDHLLWCRQQLRLMDEVGVESYLAEKI